MKNIPFRITLKESVILEYVFISALILFFFSDAANKYLIYRNTELKSISIFVRAVYETIFIGIIFLFPNGNRLRFFFLLSIWFVLFLGGQLLYSTQINFTYNFSENITHFNKYLFVFIAYFAFYRIENFEQPFKKVLKIMENLLLLNSIFIIVGFILKIILFTTYLKNGAYAWRFGYSGIVPVQNEATMFMFLVVSYFYHRHFIAGVKSWKFYCVLLSALLLGTKGIYIFLIFLFLFHFFQKLSAQKRKLAFVLVLIAIAGIYYFLQTKSAQVLLEYYLSRQKRNCFIPMLLSNRNTFFELKFLGTVKDWTPFNFLIGGQDRTVFLMEMDFFDAFLFLGVIGSVVLFILYYKTLFRFNLQKPFNLFFTFCFFFVAFFMGHFFASALNGLYLVIICLYFYMAQNNLKSFAENSLRQQ